MEVIAEFFTVIWHRLVIIVCLGIPIIALFLLIYFLQLKAEDKSEFKGVVTQPRYIMWIGVIGSAVIFVVFAITLILYFNLKLFIGMLVLWLILTLDAIYLILRTLNWQIVIEDEGITYRNLFRRKRFYRYDEITKVISAPNGMKIIIANKKILVQEWVLGTVELHKALREHNVYEVYRSQI